jgi:hypothetical protein
MGNPDELEDLRPDATPIEFEIWKHKARELQEKYAASRDEWFKSLGRDLHANPRPGRPR